MLQQRQRRERKAAVPLMEALHQDERELQLPQTVDAHTAPQLPGDKKLRTHKEMGGG